MKPTTTPQWFILPCRVECSAAVLKLLVALWLWVQAPVVSDGFPTSQDWRTGGWPPSTVVAAWMWEARLRKDDVKSLQQQCSVRFSEILRRRSARQIYIYSINRPGTSAIGIPWQGNSELGPAGLQSCMKWSQHTQTKNCQMVLKGSLTTATSTLTARVIDMTALQQQV